MRRFNMQAPARLCGAIAAVTTLIAAISLESWNQAKAAIPQPSRTVSGFNLATPFDPFDVAQVDSRFCQYQLESAIASVIESPGFDTAHWGVLIESASDSTVLYQYNAEHSLIPASNVKLLTSAAAIQIVSNRAPETLPSFSGWLTEVNRHSDNAQADALLRSIGGQSAARNALSALGVQSDGYTQVDGSGLSRNNRARPSTLVDILQAMDTYDESGLFYNSLAIAGVNGTLRNRFRDTPVQGKLYGKTGTLRGVRALSGYLANTDYGTLTFSIVVNQNGQSGRVLTQTIDYIALLAAQVERCD